MINKSKVLALGDRRSRSPNLRYSIDVPGTPKYGATRDCNTVSTFCFAVLQLATRNMLLTFFVV